MTLPPQFDADLYDYMAHGTDPEWTKAQLKKVADMDVVHLCGIDFTPDHPEYQTAIDTKLAGEQPMYDNRINNTLKILAATAVALFAFRYALTYFMGGPSV